MPEISVVVVLRVNVDSKDRPAEIERKIDAEGKRAARELYSSSLSELDDEVVKSSGAVRQRLEPRYISTMFGRVRVNRWRVKPQSGGSFHPLDRNLGLCQSEPSAGLRETLCALAALVPYRQVAEICGRVSGEEIAHLLAWRTVQQEGGRLIDEEGRAVEAIFGEHPSALTETGPRRDLVIAEADGTFLKAQGKDRTEDQTRFEVRTGVFYTGKCRAGGKKHRRWKTRRKRSSRLH